MDKLKMRLPAMILLVATLLFWGAYDRYEAVGADLLVAPSLSDAKSVRGMCTETNRQFYLTYTGEGKKPDVRFALPEAVQYELIRVEGRVRTKDVVRGKYDWNSARLILVQRDLKNKWIPTPHNLLSEAGTTDWAFHETIFKIEPNAVSAEVVLQQTGQSGAAWFESIRVYPVHLKPSFTFWRIVFAGLWFGAAVLYFRRCRLHQRKLRILILLNALAILAGALFPSEVLELSALKVREVAEYVVEKVRPTPTFSPATDVQQETVAPIKPPPSAKRPQEKKESKSMDRFNTSVAAFHKVGHFLLFASLCFFVYLSAQMEKQHPVYYAKVAFDILLFAAITEALQALTLDRSPGVRDWITDVLGMGAAFLLFLFFQFMLRVKERFSI